MGTRLLLFALAASTVFQGTEARNRTVYVSRGGDPWAPAVVLQHDQSSSRRPRRSVINLYNMLLCSTGCDPLSYKGYGCYCGFLGSGHPVDSIDRCCKMHDWCYSTANCLKYMEYIIPYYWQCFQGRPFCAIDQGHWGICAQRLCECDRMLSECLRQYPCPRRKAVCTSSTLRYLQNILMQ